MATLSNFGEQFAARVLERTYQNAVVDAIVNRNYEGEIRKPGDRVNIVSFLNDIILSDYSVGSDMSSETIIDNEDTMVVEKRRYFNFSLDRLEDLFTYAGDIPEDLLMNASKVLEREIDTYVLAKAGDADVRNWVGVNLVVTGGTQTMASITTTATGGTISVVMSASVIDDATKGATVENPVDGNLYFGGFTDADVGKGIRLRSTSTFVSPWYKITSVTNSVTASITEWDGAASGSDFEEGHTLRGLFGGDGRNFPKYGDGNASLLTMTGLGWEFQAAIATSVSAASIYDQVTLLAEALDEREVSDVDRKMTVPPTIKTQLLQAAEMQPDGIAEIYSGTVIQGRVMRFGGFDVHVAAGSRVSTRAGHPTSTGNGGDVVTTAGSTGYQLLANHTGMITYADKWAETRVVDAENQFAKKYQGLFLYGALVPAYRRKYGAVLFGNF
jgi:hypothetical protein